MGVDLSPKAHSPAEVTRPCLSVLVAASCQKQAEAELTIVDHAGVAAWLDAQGGLDTQSLCKLNILRHTRQFKSEPH
jgi:hypothetical protein